MTRFALIAAVAATLAAPAFAQSASTEFAIRHFNQSAENASDIIALPTGGTSEAFSTRNGGPLADVFAQLNQSAETQSDLRGLNGATVYSNQPAHGAEIFEALRAADDSE